MDSSNVSSAIPAFDYLRGLASLRGQIDAAVCGVLDSGRLILGPEVSGFEAEFADFVGSRFAVGVGSGTDALILALRACGVGAGAEVVTVANGCVPTIAAIRAVGAKPKFVDVAEDDLQIDVQQVAGALTADTRAVMPVHLYGYPAPIDELAELLAGRDVMIIEDCAQAHGTQLGSAHAGTMGQIGCYSFYPTKNLGAFGDGGMCVTNDADLAETVKRQRMYGYNGDRIAHEEGLNSRLDELQAALLRVKLTHLNDGIERRNAIARRYLEGLESTCLGLPCVPEDGVHAWHQFVVRHPRRDDVRRELQRANVHTGVHYPDPVHRMPAYRTFCPTDLSLPVTELACREVFSIPVFPELTDSEVVRVIDVLTEAVKVVGAE
ncbi:MAG: DegT/DnrJ/EryC1/StrS family aminotransferase [Planctomycetota bacterium]|nr:DegT/DnrJ/EryC1/StrS family aminotransferase [Planctomycetota bacterium]